MTKLPTIDAYPSVEYPGILELSVGAEVVHRGVLVPATVPPSQPARRRAKEILHSELHRRDREWAELGLHDYGGESG